jgi:acetyltransferase-like isoleucine patch superfamily enzyme
MRNTEHFKLGYRTDIGAFSYINAKYGVTIEDFVQIESHCSIYSVSTIDDKSGPVILKKNCRIGTHSVIMPGVTVGEDAVVGAFSFVNQDVPAGAVVVGVPAKPPFLFLQTGGPPGSRTCRPRAGPCSSMPWTWGCGPRACG